MVSRYLLRFLSTRLLLFAVALALILQPMQALFVFAEETGAWTSGNYPKLEINQEKDASGVSSKNCYPSIMTIQSYTNENGGFSSIPRELQVNVCKDQNALGGFGSSGSGTYSYDFITPGTAYSFRVLDPSGRPGGLIPVPGQGTFIYGQSDGNVYGGRSLRFYDSFPSAGEFGPVYGSINEMAYKLGPLGAPLKDSVGNILHMMDAYAFSSNGRWMIAEIYSLGIVRIDMQTRQVQLIDENYKPAYSQGFRPFTTLAISDDGSSAILGGHGAATTVYELSGCTLTNFTVGTHNTVSNGCRARSVQSNLSAQQPGFYGFIDMRFSGDGKSISGRVKYYDFASGTYKFRFMTYSVAGYQLENVGYIALGDSFSSGEGANDYQLGTDSANPRNRCHLSRNSYPYVAASNVGISDFHNIACSGAKFVDYFSPQENQENVSSTILAGWVPGFRAQRDLIERNTKIITISMIGNDIGFKDKLIKCVLFSDSCFHFKEDRQNVATEIYNKFDMLTGLYARIKLDAPGAKVYVVGYPQLFSGNTYCERYFNWNVTFDEEERAFANGLVTYLNSVIKAAAEHEGVQYIDVGNVFAGHRLCEDGIRAVNGITAGNSFELFGQDIPPIGSESFHPNALGHELMAQALLAQTNNFTTTMPAPNAAKTAPYVGSASYNALIGTAPSGNGKLARPIYTSMQGAELMVKTVALPVTITEQYVVPGSVFEVWAHSTPTYLGTITANADGILQGDVTVPATLDPGYHTLHFYGKDLAGKDVDIYKTVYIAASESDIDGDGVANKDEKCLVTEPANVDYDRDGIDDACDGEITEPPLDTIAPVVSGSPDREPNSKGWYRDDVSIDWAAYDADPSSGAPTIPAVTVASQEGEHTYTSDQSCDPANNCATGSVTLKIDKTAPTVDFVVNQQSNATGWNNQNVTVTFICNDVTSGIEDCSPPVEVSAEGITVVTGISRDMAGNTNEINAFISIDKTAPTLGSLQWQNNPKSNNSTASFTAPFSDNLSGVTRAEYYLGDTDPGYGNGAAMQINGQNASMQFANDFPTGVYKITTRVKDRAGNWSTAVSDYLVVYDPDGPRFTGKRTIVPSTTNGDVLPGLTAGSGMNAKFAFSIRYDKSGTISKNSDFQFKYSSSPRCNKSIECHQLELNSVYIAWLVTQGSNTSMGMFQGRGVLTVDGMSKDVQFRVMGIDGERLGMHDQDQFGLQVFSLDANPSVDAPLYKVTQATIERGNIKIR